MFKNVCLSKTHLSILMIMIHMYLSVFFVQDIITDHRRYRSPIQNLALSILICNSYDIFISFIRLSSEKDSNKY